MGVRSALIVCATSFLLGALTTNWIADSLTLWKSPVTDANLLTAASYYALVSKMPTPMLAGLGGVVALAFTALASSMWQGDAGNVMFDGASIVLFLSAGYYYTNEVLPNIARFMALEPADFANAKALRAGFTKPTLDLGTAHLVCAVALTGVIVLQGGRLWAESEEEEEDAEEAKSAPAPASSQPQQDPTPAPAEEGDNVAPRHYHSETEERAPRQGSIRKKGTTGRRAGSKRAAERG
ncbi:hypothetical protein EXIGLDRAFT_712471 [Exidia glandulosa HHB12029]|uniref:Shr3 amino acid permease chaperone n=1 Tax=Exidia glandulosa HHB12029 TaxID=1314781 RepID=A0A165MDB8_EXIGL|nr:hypothetical protein EXIGLDRAFT_712471 [Exidia glandulosa HHB12029]